MYEYSHGNRADYFINGAFVTRLTSIAADNSTKYSTVRGRAIDDLAIRTVGPDLIFLSAILFGGSRLYMSWTIVGNERHESRSVRDAKKPHISSPALLPLPPYSGDMASQWRTQEFLVWVEGCPS